MMMPYRETAEDRALTTDSRLYNGQRIDIRWSGGWLTPGGEYFPVDYRNGITHETLGEELGRQFLGSGSITTQPPVVRLFRVGRWMRITYLNYTTFCVELKGSFSTRGSMKDLRMRTLLRFVQDYKGFDSYFINDTRYDTFLDFVQAIREDKVEPVKGE